MPAEYLREEEDFEEDTLFDQAGLLTNKIKQRSDVRNASAGMRITPMKTFALCLAFFGLGLSMAILEPTLLDLQYLAATDVQHISYTITARSAGFILGSILGFLLFERYNRQFLLFLVMLAMAVLLGVLPWCHNLIAYIVILILLGALMQMLQAGGNVLCLDLWGRQSGPFLQAIHFSMALGLFIAPFLSNAILAGKAGAPVGDAAHAHNVNNLHALALPASTLFGVQITGNGKHNRHLRSISANDTNTTEFTVAQEFSNNTPVALTTTNVSLNISAAATPSTTTIDLTTQPVIEIHSSNAQSLKNSSVMSPNSTIANFSETTTTAFKSTQNDTDVNSTESTAKPHKPKPSIIDGDQLKKDVNPWVRKKPDTAVGEAPALAATTVTPLLTNSSNATDGPIAANFSTTTQATVMNTTNSSSSSELLVTTLAINQSSTPSTASVNLFSASDSNTTTTNPTPNATIINTTSNEALVNYSTSDIFTTESSTESDKTRSTTDIVSSVTLNDTSTSNAIIIANETTTSPISLPVLESLTDSSTVPEITTAPTTQTEPTISTTTQVTTTTVYYSGNTPLSENSTVTTTKATNTNLTVNNSNITINNNVLHDNYFTVDDNLTDGSSIEDSTNSTSHRKPYTFNNQTDYNQLFLTDFFNKISELGVTKVHIVYVAMAVIVLLTSIVFLSFLCHNPRELRSKQEGSPEGPNERKFVSVLTAILFIFMMFYTGAELIFSQLYLSLVLQSGAHLLRSRGSLLISVFWGVYTFSRGTSICCTNGFKPATMLILDLSCCIVSATTLVIYGPQVESILWCSVAIMAIGLSSILPYSLLWLEDYIHISNKTACAILLGNAIVHLVLSFVYGHPISLASSVVIYLVLACCVFALLLFGVAWRLATWRGDKYKASKANVRYQLANQVEDDDDNVEMAAGSSSLYLLNNETSHSNSDNLYFSLKQKKNVWK